MDIKEKRQNNTLDAFASSFIKGVLIIRYTVESWLMDEGKTRKFLEQEMNIAL